MHAACKCQILTDLPHVCKRGEHSCTAFISLTAMSSQLRLQERLQARADMRAAAAAGRTARAQLTDELPASCLGSLLALLLGQVCSGQAGPARGCGTCGLERQQHAHMLMILADERTRSIASRSHSREGSGLPSRLSADACGTAQWARVGSCASELRVLQATAAERAAQRALAAQAAAAEAAALASLEAAEAKKVGASSWRNRIPSTTLPKLRTRCAVCAGRRAKRMAVCTAWVRTRLTRRGMLEDMLRDNDISWVFCTLLWRKCLQEMGTFESELDTSEPGASGNGRKHIDAEI